MIGACHIVAEQQRLIHIHNETVQVPALIEIPERHASAEVRLQHARTRFGAQLRDFVLSLMD
jgi:hypothetical protein